MHWKGRSPPPPPLQGAQPMPSRREVPASIAFVTDSSRPQPLWQPPPTACTTVAERLAQRLGNGCGLLQNGWHRPADPRTSPESVARRADGARVGGGGGWHKALVVGSVSLWRRLLASRP